MEYCPTDAIIEVKDEENTSINKDDIKILNEENTSKANTDN